MNLDDIAKDRERRARLAEQTTAKIVNGEFPFRASIVWADDDGDAESIPLEPVVAEIRRLREEVRTLDHLSRAVSDARDRLAADCRQMRETLVDVQQRVSRPHFDCADFRVGISMLVQGAIVGIEPATDNQGEKR